MNDRAALVILIQGIYIPEGVVEVFSGSAVSLRVAQLLRPFIIIRMAACLWIS